MTAEDSEVICSDSDYNFDYVALAKIYAIINNKDFPDELKSESISDVLKTKIDINYQVPENTFFTLKHPEMIGTTALHMALDKLNLEVFKLLLKNNANLSLQDKQGETVLHKAFERSFVNQLKFWELRGKLHFVQHDFVDLLLTAHVQQNNAMNSCNKFGISNLHIACIMNHVQAVEFFVQHGVSANSDVAVTSPVLPGYTALHFAARYCNVEVVEVLISLGADVYQKDAKGLSALHVAMERCFDILNCRNIQKQELGEKFTEELNSNRRIIRMIFEKMNTNADCIGLTVLHIACILENVAMAKEIIPLVTLENFVYKDSPIWAGYTSLHVAAHVNMDMVKLLIKHGASVVAQDVNGVTPFDLCIERFTIEDIHFIITSNPLWNSIKMSDNVTKLSDFVLAFQNKNEFSSVLKMVDSNLVVPFNSSLWPGYTVLHLAILFCDRVNKLDNLYNSTDYLKISIKESDYLLQLFKDDWAKERKKFYYHRIEQIYIKDVHAVNQKNAYGSTPLHLAFHLQNRSVIRLLHMSYGVIKNVIDKDKFSHFQIACAMSYEGLVERLLVEKADANSPIPCNLMYLVTNNDDEEPLVFLNSAGWTPLHLAVVTANSCIAMMLLKYGADANARDADDLTPIHRVLQIDNYEVVKTILSVIELKNCVTYFGLSHFHIACLVGADKQVERLLHLGADIEAPYTLPAHLKDSIDEKRLAKRLYFLKDYAGYTPLYIATIEGHFDVISLLIKRGANVLVNNSDSPVLLEELICSNDYDLNHEFLNRFLKKNKCIQRRLQKNIGLTPLHLACFDPIIPDEGKVKSILECNSSAANACINANSPVWAKKTALHILAMYTPMLGSEYDYDYCYVNNKIQSIATLLLKYEADVTLEDINHTTPIHEASERLFWEDEQGANNMAGIKKNKIKYDFPSYLVAGQRNFSLNPVSIRGMSHFHVACACNEVKSVKNFLKHDVDVNRPFGYFCNRYSGFTPLHLAAFHKNGETVELLLQHGASVHAEDSLGNTPLHVAADYCPYYSNVDSSILIEDIFEMLIDEGAQVDSLNMWGETPLGVYSRSGMISFKGFEIFIRESKCCVNIFNMKTGYGLLADILPRYASYDAIKKSFFFEAVVKNPLRLKNNVDPMKRSVIHNIVSTRREGIIPELYTRTIQGFIEIGFDVDHRDKRGWTALHAAAHFGNYNGIIGLLENGADINVSDLENKSAITLSIECPETNEENRSKIAGRFLLVVYLMEIADLRVSATNKEMIAQISDEFVLHERDTKVGKMELGLLKMQKVDTMCITWFDLLCHTKAALRVLRSRPAAITKIFANPKTLRAKFPAFGGLLIMQYRKAIEIIERIELFEKCLKIISKSKFLSNGDLKNVLKAIE